MLRRLTMLLTALALVTAACGDDDEGAASSTAAPTTAPPATAAPTTAAPTVPLTAPAEVVFEDQESDGETIVVASVTLPAPGFIAVHGNSDGAPGAVIGHSALLPAGTSTDVTIDLDTALEATDLVFPMAHIDVNEDGAYQFSPPDDTTDGPARTETGDIAVVGGEVTVAEADGSAQALIVIEGFDFGDPITVAAGTTVIVRNTDGVAHTWTAEDGSFDSGSLSEGEEFEMTFDLPGEYAFFCRFHPSMTGTLTVTP